MTPNPTCPIIRLGILGTASIAPWAAVKPAQQNPAVTVHAVAARELSRAQAFARKHAIPQAYGSYAELLADGAIDAVYIPLPNSLHAAWTLRALDAGKHVLCEKPLAANAQEAAAMAAKAEQCGLVLAEAFHYRYHPLARRAREIVQSGELGAIRHVDIQFCTPSVRPNTIRFDYALGGGVTMDLGCYAVDMVRFLTRQEPTVTQAAAKLAGPQVDRTMDVRFDLDDGATAHMFCSMRSTCLFRTSVRVAGTAGTISVANLMLPQLLYHRLKVTTATGARVEKFTKTPTYDYQLQAFANALHGVTPMETSGAEGVKNMRVIDAIYQAAGLLPRGEAA